MKTKLCGKMFMLIIIFFNFTSFTEAKSAGSSYAKWGQLAMKTAKEKYPTAKIVDYQHIGRQDKENLSIEKFKLLLVESGEEFSLYIHIEFNPGNDSVISVSAKKSPH
ncbi:DUF3889 domain-containing protein [Bacillus sp. Bva_UNVM-123]|uniref:DUF3889 domain-containing protein n=1 Tax=Bacillus sp. Bva_UNVM-123 TaxID=2829798 RepID=UPI00391F322B